MRILWTLPYLPWPTTSGMKTREFHLMRNLAGRGHRITLLVHSQCELDDQTRYALEPWLEGLIVIHRRPLRSARTLLAVAFAKPPMLACVNGFSAPLEDAFQTLLKERWDVIQIAHSYAFQPFEEALRRCGKRFILSEHHLESASNLNRHTPLATWAKPFARFDRWRYRQWEQRVLPQTCELIAVTEDDAKQFARLTRRATSVVVNGVDCEYYAKVSANPYSRRLLFIGNYEHGPNLDAVEWALEHIMPIVWQLNPLVRLSIGGYAMPEHWRDRWSDPRIQWLGFVPDLRSVQQEAAIFFAPLREGGGCRLKVIEAMAAGLAVVTTGQGRSGLNVANGTHCLGSDDPQELASLLAQVIEQPSQLERIGQAGRAYVRQHHDWAVSAAQLERVYSRLRHQQNADACV